MTSLTIFQMFIVPAITAGVSLAIALGFYKAVISRALDDIKSLGVKYHAVSNRVEGILKEADERYPRKSEIIHLRDGQVAMEKRIDEMSLDVKLSNRQNTDILVAIAKLSTSLSPLPPK